MARVIIFSIRIAVAPTQDHRDAWFVGYIQPLPYAQEPSPLVVGVWVGNDDGTPTHNITGGRIPAAIWKDYMTRVRKMSR